MVNFFHQLEKFAQSRHDVREAFRFLELRLTDVHTSYSKELISHLKTRAQNFVPAQLDGKFIDQLQGCSSLDKFMVLKRATVKSQAFSLLKTVEGNERNSNKKKLLKTNSLMVAYSENFFLGIQLLDRLHNRKISSHFR